MNIVIRQEFMLQCTRYTEAKISLDDPMLYREINQRIATAIIKDMFYTLKQDGNNLFILLLSDDASSSNAAYYNGISSDLGFLYTSFLELSHEYRKNRQKYHFKYDGHFNEKGNILLANALSNFLCNKVLETAR